MRRGFWPAARWRPARPIRPAPLATVPPLHDRLSALRHALPDGSAVSTAGPLSLRDVAALAVLNDPDLVAARAQHDVAAADLLSAGLPPDPSITGGFAALLGGPASMSSISAGFMQDIGALITYKPDRQAARAGLAQVDAGILWQEWQVASQAEQLAVPLATDQATIASLQQDAIRPRSGGRRNRAPDRASQPDPGDAAASIAALATVQVGAGHRAADGGA